MIKRVVGTISMFFAILISAAVPGRAQEPANNLPLVWVLSTGGTIAGAGASPTNVANYRGGQILGEDLVKAVPEIKQFANVQVEQVLNVRSPDIKIGNPLTLANGTTAIF